MEIWTNMKHQFRVGQILKKLYIDSALKKDKKEEEKRQRQRKKKPVNKKS